MTVLETLSLNDECPVPMTSLSFPSSPPQSDDLAAVVVRRLEKGSACRSWGLMKTILLGVPSFGLLPLLVWPARFRGYVADESLAMQELAQWAKVRGRQPAAVGPLLAAAEDTALNPLPVVSSLILVALIVGMFAIQFTHASFTLERLFDSTYGHTGGTHFVSPLPAVEFLYRVWVIALSIGYAIQFFQVRAHTADVQRFVARFNPVAEAERLPPIRFPRGGGAYFRPLWILAAVLLCMYGAWWGIPMVLAGMAQRRYTSVTGKLVRCELAKRVRDVVTLRQAPSVMLTSPMRRCSNPRCLAVISPKARFCTRCGSAIPEART